MVSPVHDQPLVIRMALYTRWIEVKPMIGGAVACRAPPNLGRKINYSFFMYSVLKVFGESFFAFQSLEEAVWTFAGEMKIVESRLERGVLQWRKGQLCWAWKRGKLKEATKWGLEHFLRRLGWQAPPLRPLSQSYMGYWRDYYESCAWDKPQGPLDFFLTHGHPETMPPGPHGELVGVTRSGCGETDSGSEGDTRTPTPHVHAGNWVANERVECVRGDGNHGMDVVMRPSVARDVVQRDVPLPHDGVPSSMERCMTPTWGVADMLLDPETSRALDALVDSFDHTMLTAEDVLNLYRWPLPTS